MTSPGTATPTEADFASATHYLVRFHADTSDTFATPEERAIAQALADQRARYEALADELENTQFKPIDSTERGFKRGLRAAAQRIRLVAR